MDSQATYSGEEVGKQSTCWGDNGLSSLTRGSKEQISVYGTSKPWGRSSSCLLRWPEPGCLTMQPAGHTRRWVLSWLLWELWEKRRPTLHLQRDEQTAIMTFESTSKTSETRTIVVWMLIEGVLMETLVWGVRETGGIRERWLQASLFIFLCCPCLQTS